MRRLGVIAGEIVGRLAAGDGSRIRKDIEWRKAVRAVDEEKPGELTSLVHPHAVEEVGLSGPAAHFDRNSNGFA